MSKLDKAKLGHTWVNSSTRKMVIGGTRIYPKQVPSARKKRA